MTRLLCLFGILLAVGAASCVETYQDRGHDGAADDSSLPDAGPGGTEGGAEPLADGTVASADLRSIDAPASDSKKASFVILSIQADPQKIAAGGSVTLKVKIRNDTATALAAGEVWIEAKCPDGRLFNQKIGLDLAAGATGEATQVRGPYTVVGDWLFTPSLRDAAGKTLASGPSVKVPVYVPPITNPLSGIVGYTQINLSSTKGSCGSHSGAVAIAYLKGLKNDVAGTTSIEKSIYSKVPYAPGESSLKSGYNSYMNGAGVAYTSVNIGSGSVLGYLQKGSPVVAHVYNHYVTLYGLTDEGGTSYVYFSDGATGYSTSGSWSIGASGHLRKMSWSAFKNKMYGGYIGFDHK